MFKKKKCNSLMVHDPPVGKRCTTASEPIKSEKNKKNIAFSRSLKGSDASWKNDHEPPPEVSGAGERLRVLRVRGDDKVNISSAVLQVLDFSDDEQEQDARRKLKNSRRKAGDDASKDAHTQAHTRAHTHTDTYCWSQWSNSVSSFLQPSGCTAALNQIILLIILHFTKVQ